jgi:hypothetical protein
VDNKDGMEPGGFEGEWNLGGLALEHRNKGENDKVEKCEGGRGMPIFLFGKFNMISGCLYALGQLMSHIVFVVLMRDTAGKCGSLLVGCLIAVF